MKTATYVVCVYAILLMIGGIIGFVKAGSLPSLITASIFGGVLLRYGYALSQNYPAAFGLVVGNLLLILVFFSYRYYLSKNFMPAGMVIIMTIAVLGYLVWEKKREMTAP